MNIPKKTKKKKYNIDYHLEEVRERGVTINPIAFLVIQPNNVKLMPVNHTSSLDKLLDYMPDLIEKTNNMMNRHIQNKKEETQKILKEMSKQNQEVIEKEAKAKKKAENKVKEKIKEEMLKDEEYEFEYDETLEDE